MSVHNGLDFDLVNLQEVNLFVGISGAGKSKLLTSLFKVARFAIGNEKNVNPFLGAWIIEAEIDNKRYRWECQRESDSERQSVIIKEEVQITDISKNETSVLVERTKDNFVFNNDSLPKLDISKSCIELLKDEEKIKPLYLGFTNVIRRNFSRGELSEAANFASVDKSSEDLFAKPGALNKALYSLFNFPLNVRLYFISRFLKKEYQLIVDSFKELFPNITDCLIVDAHKEKIILSPGMYTPAFMVMEDGIKNRIPLKELSSGMVKVLLILTDIFTMPDGFIYELDEYENSLGVNIINFLPSLLLEHQKSKQFLITTHHPYLINKMPVSNWYVLGRNGAHVNIKYGDELVKRYGKSSQESFIKLINDPFYSPENK